jgi:hypothetical protein
VSHKFQQRDFDILLRTARYLSRTLPQEKLALFLDRPTWSIRRWLKHNTEYIPWRAQTQLYKALGGDSDDWDDDADEDSCPISTLVKNTVAAENTSMEKSEMPKEKKVNRNDDEDSARDVEPSSAVTVPQMLRIAAKGLTNASKLPANKLVVDENVHGHVRVRRHIWKGGTLRVKSAMAKKVVRATTMRLRERGLC